MSIVTSKINIERSLRITHRWIALFIIIPLFITTATGVLLLLRHQVEWVQPSSLKLSHVAHWATIEQVLTELKNDPRTHRYKWQDMGSVIYKPSKGVIQLRTRDDQLIQLDGTSAEILSIAPRRTSWLIQLHEGTYWGKAMRLYVFLPAALGLLLLLISGGILIVKHYKKKLKKYQRGKSNSYELPKG